MISLLSLLLFTGCNFNEEAEDAPVTISDVDLAYSAIGITYVCSSGIVAYTDSSGVFSCNKSDNVTVYLGSNEIITISDKGDLITPYDLFEGDSEAALNYVRLLEVLDTNNGANGALELDEEALEKLPNDLDFSSVTFEQEVESILQTQLITRTEAQEKLNTEVVNAGGTIPNGSNQPVGVITESVSGTLVSVNASLSSDADNDSLTYQWDLKSPDGSTAVLSSTTAEVVTFVTDKSGIYTVSLIVNDSNIDSVLVTKNIDIAPTQIFPPVSDAGVTQSVLTNLPVTLDGTLSNPNGAAITYNWDIVFQPANSSIVLSDESLPKPTFTPLKGGQYIFDLNVSNVNGSSVDRVIINVTSTNLAPVANAGTNQNVSTPSPVTLDGSSSSDANSDTLTYAWTLVSEPGGSSITLSGANTVSPTFTANVDGTYVFSLVVNDGQVDSAGVNVTITASTPEVPVANAGVDQSVLTNAVVTLDGTLSDPKGEAISYSWSIVSQPALSTITLSSTIVSQPTFTPIEAGDYTFNLTVSNVNGSSVDSIVVSVINPNIAPVANAGTSQAVDTSSLVTLNGSSSSDANGDTLTYSWTLVSEPGGSSITLSNATTVSPTFTANVDGIYEFSLVVNDGQVDSADVNVTITASTPEVPVANAGVDQNVFTNAVVTLDGTLSDDKGEIISYSWSITAQPISSSITLSNTAVSQPTFTPVVDGNYTFDLNVSNVNGSSVDSIVVSVINPNAAPVANAGTNQNVATPSSVTLNGSASSDANGDTLTFAWTLVSEPDGSSITLANANTVSPTFTANVDGVYEFSLVVNDGQVDSAGVTVSVTASTLNIAPIANAGIDQNVPVGATVSLDGNSSSDANDGDVLTYAWTLVRPALSNAILTSETSAFPSFTADEAGIYSIQLIVKDDENLSSAIDTVVVTVSITNSAPTANAGVDGTVYQNAAYTLDGSGSFDSDGDTITYAWSIFTGGSGSFSDDTVVNPTFTPAQSGAYVLQLVVNDGDLLSNVDKMTLTVLAVEDLKKSGQTIVYTTNDDGTYQKGAASNYTVSSSGTSTVKDEVTSLSWSNVSAGNKLYAEAEAYCSSLDVDGISDWRIPTENELFTIVNFANSSPSIDSVFSINYPYRYWTSTLNNGFNVVINFMDATTEIAGGYNDIRCVSGNRVTQNYTRDDTNNIVNDNIHNIMWADINNSVLLNNGEFTFVDAISYCEDLTHGSFSDWRLPNIVELISATDFENKTSVFNVHFDENMNEAWSSTASTYFSGGYVYTVKNAGSTFSPDEAIVDNNLKDTSFSGSNESKLKCVRDSL